MAHSHGTMHFDDCEGVRGACRCEQRRYKRVLMISFVIFIFEIAGGYLSGSLALFSDGWHVFTDMSAILLSMLVANIASQEPLYEHQVRSMGFVINIALLLLVAYLIGMHAWDRWQSPHPVVGPIMLIVALIGGVGNWWQHQALHGNEHTSTHQVLDLHILSDLVQSIGVVLAAVLIAITGLIWIDPVVSMMIALWMALQAILLVKKQLAS